MNHTQSIADIAIVGGGPAGLAFAAICEQQGLDYILYERSARDTPPRGGCLDLHEGSGQRAMKEAGVFNEFKKYARAGDATIHLVYDHQGNQVASWGEGRNSPELDRYQIKEALLTGIPEQKIVWRKGLESAERDQSGKIVLKFADGTSATGFRLVVGADGTFSKVRPLITTAVPTYFGCLFLTASVTKTNPFYDALHKKAGAGPMVHIGRSTMNWCQQQGNGDYRIDYGIAAPQNFAKSGAIDLDDLDAVKKLLLSDKYFGHHNQFFKDMTSALEGPVRDWPLWEMPVDALAWKPSQDVTLIGDAAHTTTPFVGDGANCAMRDSVILALKLKEFGFSQEAIAAYETEMFGFAKTMITDSHKSGQLFFEADAPTGFVKMMNGNSLIGATDTY